MTIRTRISMTTEESAPGVPLWGPNAVTTDMPIGATEIAIENLIAGAKYYVKSWNEDNFGNKSREVTRIVNAARPLRESLVTFGAQGVLDEGSPMYAFVKIPANVVRTSDVQITLAFRQFMAPATAATATGTLTSVSGGGATSGSSSAGSSSSGGSATSTGGGDHSHIWAQMTSTSPSATATSQKHQDGAHSTNNFNLTAEGSGNNFATQTTSAHTHNVASHTHAIPHTHSTPAHTHDITGHSHALTYGTYEETYPTSHSCFMNVYKRVGGAWVLQDTFAYYTTDLVDIDVSSVITGPGDWRLAVASQAGQPNGGRLGCDLYGSMTLHS